VQQKLSLLLPPRPVCPSPGAPETIRSTPGVPQDFWGRQRGPARYPSRPPESILDLIHIPAPFHFQTPPIPGRQTNEPNDPVSHSLPLDSLAPPQILCFCPLTPYCFNLRNFSTYGPCNIVNVLISLSRALATILHDQGPISCELGVSKVNFCIGVSLLHSFYCAFFSCLFFQSGSNFLPIRNAAGSAPPAPPPAHRIMSALVVPTSGQFPGSTIIGGWDLVKIWPSLWHCYNGKTSLRKLYHLTTSLRFPGQGISRITELLRSRDLEDLAVRPGSGAPPPEISTTPV